MIIGIGIDSVEIDRFKNWHHYSKKNLLRIFSSEEISYCLAEPTKSAERFAVRFAAREACYKALHTYYDFKLPFLSFCKLIQISKNSNGHPQIMLDYETLLKKISVSKNPPIRIWLSLTHSKTIATAFVILEI